MPGAAKSEDLNAKGSSIDGKVLKNSTPAVKLDIVSPEVGSKVTGTSAVMSTLSGPNSLNANLMPNPPIPFIENLPSTPTKKTRWSTSVTVSSGPIILESESSFKIPPIKDPTTSPPKTLPLTPTPMDSISTIGFLPSSSNFGEILIPFMAPLNSRPLIPLISVSSADNMMEKSVGSASISSH